MTGRRMSMEANELPRLPPAEAARIAQQILGRVAARADEITSSFPSTVEVPRATGWFGSVCPLLFGIRLLSESLEDRAHRGCPSVRVRTEHVDGESRSIARVFPTRAWHRATLPTTTADVWIAPSVTDEDVLQAQADRARDGAGDARIMVVDAGSTIEGALNVLHHVLADRRPVVLVSRAADDESTWSRLLDGVLEPLLQRGWVSRSTEEALAFEPETMQGLHLGPRAVESAQTTRAPFAGRIWRDAAGLTPLLVLPYLYERKELVAIARWVTVQHRSPMPWLGRRLLVLPEGWRQRDAFTSLLVESLGEQGLREIADPNQDPSHATGAPLDVLSVGSEDVETFLGAAAAQLSPLRPVCTAFAVDARFETDPAFEETFHSALARWPSRVLAVNHSPEVAYSLTSLPWPSTLLPAREAHDGQQDPGEIMAHNSAMLAHGHVDRVVLRRRLWPYPRPPWEQGKRAAPSAAALASLLASPGVGRWASLLWTLR